MKKYDGEEEDISSEPTRREFLVQAALAATSALVLPGVVRNAAAQTPANPALATLGEIASIKGTGKLKGVIKIKNGTKNIPGWTTRPMLRYFEGYNQQGPDAGKIWPADKTACLPGPTLRVGVGERVELTLINQVDVGAFGGSLDQAETGATDGCDQ